MGTFVPGILFVDLSEIEVDDVDKGVKSGLVFFLAGNPTEVDSRSLVVNASNTTFVRQWTKDLGSALRESGMYGSVTGVSSLTDGWNGSCHKWSMMQDR